MPNKYKLLKLLFILFMLVSVFACKTVKPYQRAYLNDDAMQVTKKAGDKFPGAVHTYREAAAGGGRGKTSGGCGCN